MLNGYGEGSSIPAYGPTVLRLIVGVVFVGHGARKLFGAWGGLGLAGTTAAFTELGLEPAYPLAVIAGAIELCGGLMLLLGAFTVLVSLALIGRLLVGSWKLHLANGFFLSGNGVEYDLTLIAALVCLALTGPGAFSVEGRRASHAAAAAAGRARVRFGRV